MVIPVAYIQSLGIVVGVVEETEKVSTLCNRSTVAGGLLRL